VRKSAASGAQAPDLSEISAAGTLAKNDLQTLAGLGFLANLALAFHAPVVYKPIVFRS
jgi:hypothetical protein